MFRNYFKTAWRNLLKNKFYSLINMAGLTAGLVIGILILLWVQDERSFDGFHKKAADIYRLELFGGTGASKQIWSMTVAPIGPLAKKELPEVAEQLRMTYNNYASLYKYRDKSFADERAMFTDPSLFTMFDFPLVEGSAAQPFPDAHSVVITRKTAKKFFGDEPALGKVISTETNENYTVSGVIDDLPLNSTIQFDMLMPMTLMMQKWLEAKIDLNHDFNSYMYFTFLQLKHGVSPAGLGPRLNQVHLRNKPEDTDADYLLLPLNKMHLYNADGSDAGAQTVTIFMIVALLILTIACINYVNLSTARAMLRSKEVSLRKIVGAAKMQLFLQFVVETALLFLFSAVLAVVSVRLVMPLFNQISGKQLVFDIANGRMWTVILCTIGATLVASSIYPAMLLSSFDPLKALKSKLSISRGDAAFRKTLVVIQFASSVILIIGTLVIYRQLNYIRHKDLGYDKSHVFSFWMRDMRPAYETAKGKLLGLTGVQGVTASTNTIIDMGGISGDNEWDGKAANQTFIVHPIAVDKDFFSFFKMQLAEGEGFTGTKADSTHFLLNETAIKEIGLQHPIGKRFRSWKINGTIVGVVKDFHFGSMKQKIAPALFYSQPDILSRMYIRTTGENAAATIRAAEELFKQYNAGYPFSYAFLDESFNQLYQSEEREGTLFFYFAAMAIIISCLGLFALAAYATHLRFREIGIRKVLGASVPGIIALLAKDFVRLVLLGILIAVPVAWYAMHQWLTGFAYRTDLNWTVFVIAGLITIVIALATISFQAVKAAVANPVASLKTE
ncbi:ABC transporter permease [Puia dinghuensis]|nr:ABC transporter permease [Puia dinghuensis]